MLDYTLYAKFCDDYNTPYWRKNNPYEYKIYPITALHLKCLLNAKGYCTYNNSPNLAFKFIKEGLTNKVFSTKNKKITIEEKDGVCSFNEIDNGIYSFGKIEGFNFNHTIFNDKGFFIINAGIRKKRFTGCVNDTYVIEGVFYDMESVLFLNSISDDKLGENIKRDDKGYITNESISYLLSNPSLIEQYIKPDFKKTYFGEQLQFSIPSLTEPQVTSIFEQCYSDCYLLLNKKFCLGKWLKK